MLFRSPTSFNLSSIVSTGEDEPSSDSDCTEHMTTSSSRRKRQGCYRGSALPFDSVVQVRLPHVLELYPGVYAVTNCDMHPIPEDGVVVAHTQTHTLLRSTNKYERQGCYHISRSMEE
jgi:hypothetical protein